MTVHAAKGLEFPHVFLCGLSEGIFPSRKIRTRDAMEEERRLAFVALTRAEKTLHLSAAEGRSLDGSPRYVSRFILDISPELLCFSPPPRDGLIAAARDHIRLVNLRLSGGAQTASFNSGDRVVHKVFGAGTVLEPDLASAAYLIQFDSMDTPRSISFRVALKPEAEA